MESNIKITILGNSAAIPTKDKNLTSHLVVVNGEHFLIDCGEGTQMQLIRHEIKYHKIDNIFISHLHGDHFFGLIGLISTYHLLGRERKLNIYSPPGLKEIILLQLETVHTKLNYELEFHEISAASKQKIYQSKYAVVYAFPLEHRVVTNGYFFEQPKKQRNISKEFVEEHSPSIEEIKKIKEGGDFNTRDGQILKNKSITSPPPPRLSYAYCSDTRYNEKIPECIRNVSVLYHEATFDVSFQELAIEKYHSTSADAARTALQANAGQLILGHFSARNSNTDIILEESTSIFPHTIISEEGVEYIIQN